MFQIVVECMKVIVIQHWFNTVDFIIAGYPVITQAPQDVTTVEGSTVTFTCRAEAVPAVTSVSWVFQSEQLSTNLKYEVFGNGDLRINNIEKDQEGMYSCQAVNSIGQSEIKSAYLTVMGEKMLLSRFNFFIN